ncbi:PP2C family protein-serine/threonine phosphatase [Actinoallomurus acanthiterrae]
MAATVVDALRPLDGPEPLGEPGEALTGAFTAASRALRVLCDEHSSAGAASLTVAVWSGGRFTIAHVGRSRGYLLRDHVLVRITKDHTLAALRVEAGEMPPRQAAESRDRRLLVRWLDGRAGHSPDVSPYDVHAGDRILLCTSGLETVDAPALQRVLGDVRDPATTVAELMDRADDAGRTDDVACVVVDVPTGIE